MAHKKGLGSSKNGRDSQSKRLGVKLAAPLSIGPELDADGLAALRERLRRFRAAEVYALWLRGRANGVLVTFGHPAEPLSELALQDDAFVHDGSNAFEQRTARAELSVLGVRRRKPADEDGRREGDDRTLVENSHGIALL